MAKEMPPGQMLPVAGGGNSAPSPREERRSTAVMKITVDSMDPLLRGMS